MTGEPIWESQPVQVVHLLGISRNRLFVTLGGYPQGIRCYDTAHRLPVWTRPDQGDLAPYGRGLLYDRWLFWATRHLEPVLRQVVDAPHDSVYYNGPPSKLQI